MKFGQRGIIVACLALAAPGLLLVDRACAEEDIRGKTIRFSRAGVNERKEIIILKNGRVFVKSDGTGYSSGCSGGGSEGTEGSIGRAHSYSRGCQGRKSAATTRIAYKDGVLTINDTHKAGHTFFTNYRIKISGRTCSGSWSAGYRSMTGYTAAPAYTLSPCVVE